MIEPQPRFEFRVWGQNLSGPTRRLRELAEPAAMMASDEVYVVAEGCDDTNTKIRHEVLDVKVLQRVVDRCEQWQPWIKAEFPIPALLLGQQLLPRLGVPDLRVERDIDAVPALIELLRGRSQIGVARVCKQRTKYMIAGCLAEISIVAIDGHRLLTTAIESTDLAAVCELRGRLHLEQYENVSYPRAIKLTMHHASNEPEFGNGH